MSARTTRIERILAQLGPSRAETNDPSPWDWYAKSCPCGLPAGECREHPRARPTQRPPDGDWRVWAYIAGRGAGKTRAGASWIQQRVESGTMKYGCLIAPTAADIRDVMVEGPSGLLAVAPPWARPRFKPSETPAHLAQRRPRGLLERRKAGARSWAQHRLAVGRRIGLLAAGRINVGPGDAGAANRRQSPGHDHDNPAASLRSSGASWTSRRPSGRPTRPTPTKPSFRPSSSVRS